MKKILTFLLSVCMIIPNCAFAYTVTDYAESAEGDYQSAASLVYAISDIQFPTDSETVTRGDFLTALVKLSTNNQYYSNNSSFNDITTNSVLSYCAAYAQNCGMIAGGDSFEPAKSITSYQAIKMAIIAIGYKDNAIVKGGYPTGFISIARENKLFRNYTQQDKEINAKDAYSILYDMLTAKLNDVSAVYDDYTVYHAQDETLLSKLYDISVIEGIVKADPYTSLTSAAASAGDDTIYIGNYEIILNGLNAYLGYSVRAFVTQKNSVYSAVAISPYNTKTVDFNGYDYVRTENRRIVLEDEVKEKSFSIDFNADVIFNGKSYAAEDINSLLSQDTVTARLIENDNDNSYDVLLIDSWSYCLVKTVDAENGIITDKNTIDNKIDVSADDCKYSLQGEGITDIYDISADMLLAYTVSEDQLYKKIVLCSDTVKGKLLSIDYSGNKVEVGDTTCDYGEYFQKYYTLNFHPNVNVTVQIGINGEAVALNATSAAYHYGYLVSVKDESGFQDAQLKIYTDTGKMMIYDISEKVSIDGIKSTSENLVNRINSITDESRLVRFLLNAEEEVSNVDFSSDAANELSTAQLPEDNSLQYFKSGSFKYNNTSKIFGGKFSINQSKIFVVPTETTNVDPKYYKISDGSCFDGDRNYTVEIYDLDSTGHPAIIIYKTDISNQITNAMHSAVVQKINVAVDEEKENCYVVDLYQDTKYSRYFSTEDNEAEFAALKPGDIIRFSLEDDGKHIAQLQIEYSYTEDRFINTYSDGATLNFAKGYVYDNDGAAITLLNEKRNTSLAASSFVPTFERLTTITYLKPIYIYIDQDKNGTVKAANVRFYPGQAIMSYVNAGENASFAVVERNYYVSKALFMYITTK